MTPPGYPRLSNNETILLAALAAALSAMVFLLEARVGFDARDEGFLWYGVQEVLRGNVPIRDFMAYDIGRYYWSAAFAALVGDDGIVSLRGSVAVFQAVGLAAALVWLARADRRRLVLALGAVIVLLWMAPRHKVFDSSLALILIATLAWMLEAPSTRRYFGAGVVLGIVAMFGRNHGLYGAVAMVAGVAWNRMGSGAGPAAWPALRSGAAGVVAGYAPMLALLGLDAGFRQAFFADLLQVLEFGSTNLPLPVPWPHLAFAGGESGFPLLRKALTGLMFVAFPVFVLAGVAQWRRMGTARLQSAPLFVACLLLALPYAHFAFSRADLSHLAQGLFPVLLGILAWPGVADAGRAAVAGTRAALLLLVSLVVVLPFRPAVAAQAGPPWIEMAVGDDRLLLRPSVATDLALVRRLVGERGPGARDVLIAPHWVGMYPALDLRSPVWEIYALFPRDERLERDEIGRIEAAGVRLAIIQDLALDGRDELRYRNTHPLIQAHLAKHFRLARNERTLQVYRRPAPGDSAGKAARP